MSEHLCNVCKRPLPEGSRYCVACGNHSFDPYQHIQEGAEKKAKAERWERFKEWLYGLITGSDR